MLQTTTKNYISQNYTYCQNTSANLILGSQARFIYQDTVSLLVNPASGEQLSNYTVSQKKLPQI